ncbi:hypothetical protein IFM89_017988 [Coptis chinensis]|uniref:Hexosyltransferase n=1 Tax=Coptis chinensis TaxID=261450 RepID=A0A835HRH3_9MAGN|nr:hypothetical protein IFM89_017988 [Coptis chinensis]
MRLKIFSVLRLLVILFSLVQLQVVSASKSEEAYVTLLYGDEFLLGVRVLGKSIRDTKSTKDMVVLVSDGVSNYAKQLLKADGWIVEMISLLANPNQVRPTRFWGVYTKLKIFNMTDYKKVVYLDADTIVLKNIDELFKCGKFCGNLKHSERMNSGVMVVEPSQAVFEDMMSKVTTLKSYTGGDQGFLNSYYVGFANAHLFEPDLSSEERNSRPVPAMERLSTLYNADVGLYALANKWMVDEEELRVIHYTLGPLKPWDWWTAWLLQPVDLWQIRKDLFGEFCRSSICNQIRHLYYKFRSGVGVTYSSTGVSSSSILNSSEQMSNAMLSKVPAYLGGTSVMVCFTAALVSLAFAVAIVPRQVMPWTGLFLVYEWTFLLFLMTFGGYLRLLYRWGKATTTQAESYLTHVESFEYDSGKGHQRQVSACDFALWYYGLGMAFLAVAATLLPCIFGITALLLRVALMVGGGIVLACFMTHASEHLAIRAFLRGREDRDTPRTRTICLIC